MKPPVRLQLSRSRGFDLQAASLAKNGLPASRVSRPGQWGNPYVVGGEAVPNGATAVMCFRAYAEGKLKMNPDWLAPLKGRNLACWCKSGEPCHADVLLELANR